ncbi:MAG: efflux RND transporter periplasmic adaptor subunit [Mariprofundaceae bacterium]|nr:efflux RND transporter periplasmic adaptor subunit [Mariprofundaceae bacterium]
MKRCPQALALPAIGMFALLFSACGDQGGNSVKLPAKPVVVLKAHTLMLSDQMEALGTAQANESITITAKVSGRLEEIAFTDGQQVRKGDLIVRLDQDEEYAQLIAAEVQLAEHTREVKRLQTLLARRAAATRELDERKTLAAVAASNIEQIKARISELTLKAPFDGKVGIRRVSPGALIQPGQVIVTLDEIDPIKLDFSIPSTMLQGLKPGDRIEARAEALGDRVFTGRVTATDSRIDPLTRSMLLRAIIDNPDGELIPGMLMRVTLLANEREAVVVPEESITQKQERHFITLVTADGKAEIRAVQTGLRRDGLVEIRQGLAAGELVVVRGMGFVKPGQAVSVSETWETIRDSQFPAR